MKNGEGSRSTNNLLSVRLSGFVVPLLATLVAGLVMRDYASKPPTIAPDETFPAAKLGSPLPSEPHRSAIDAGKIHIYWTHLNAGQVLDLRVGQEGADLKVFLRGRGELLEQDSPTGNQGLEQITYVASRAEKVTLEIEGGEAPGAYDLETLTRARATPGDQLRAQAIRHFARATGRLTTLPRGDLSDSDRASSFAEAISLWRKLGAKQDESWALYDFLARDRKATATLEAGERHRLFERAIALYAAANNHWRVARLYHRQAAADYEDRRLTRALKLYQKSFEAWSRLGKTHEMATVLNDMGRLFWRNDRTHEALEAFHKSRDAYRKLSDPCSEASALINIGKLEAYHGETRTAWEKFEQATQLVETCPNRDSLRAIALTEAGNAARALGEIEVALSTYREALALRVHSGDQHGRAITLNNLGLALIQVQRPEEVLEAFDEARLLFQQLDQVESVVVVQSNMCWAQELLGRLDQAYSCYRDLLPSARAIQYQKLEFNLLIGAARVLFQLTVNSPAEAAFREAATQQLNEAWAYLIRAFDRVEFIRSQALRNDLRVALLASRSDLFTLATRVALEKKHREPNSDALEAAFALLDRSHARSLMDRLERLPYPGTSTHRASSESTESPARQAVNRRHLEVLAQNPDGAVPNDLELQDSLEALRQHQAANWTTSKTTEITRATIPLVQKALGDAVLVHLQAAPSLETGPEASSYLWVVTREGVRVEPIDDPRLSNATLRRLHKLLSTAPRERTEPLLEPLLAVSRALLQPLAEELERYARLMVVPSGALSYIPFDVLLYEGSKGTEQPRHLVFTHEVAHLPSASSLVALRAAQAQRPLPTKKALVFADPIFGPADRRLRHRLPSNKTAQPPAGPPLDSFLRSRLIHTRAEAASIGRAFEKEVDVFLGFSATRQHLLRISEAYEILHVATHGLTQTSYPELTSLMFSQYDATGRPVTDGFLRAHEIESLRLTARLVVLSACSSALGREMYGEGLIGLPHAFMASGTPRVVVTLWDVDDRATSQLMKYFYNVLATYTTSYAEALRQSKVAFLEKELSTDPFYWSAFILHGDPAADSQSRPAF